MSTAANSATSAGSYDFGFIDTTAYTGELTYTAVTKVPGYWKFTATGYGVGDDLYAFILCAIGGVFTTAIANPLCSTDTSIAGIADTGTTLIYLPAAVVQAYYAEVSGATVSLAQTALSPPPPSSPLTHQGVRHCDPPRRTTH